MPMNALIIRTSWVYSEYGNNFVSTMLRLGRERDELSVVNDQIGSPTYAVDLAGVILEIIKHKKFRDLGQTTQIYNYSNEGKISWHEFAKEIFKIGKIECEVNSIASKQYPTPAKRPRNTFINKDKIVKVFNIKISNWKFSLNTCMKILKQKQ
jgi:dTDP-4-dehydrorhamnose reductase